MSSIRSVSSRSSIASSSVGAPTPAGAEAPQGFSPQDIQLTTMPTWGLAQPPQVMATPPKPSLASRVLRKPGSAGGVIGGVAGGLGAVTMIATLISLACTGPKLGASWNGDSSWPDALNNPDNGFSGSPAQPQYYNSDQCVGVGMALGITSPLSILLLAFLGGAIGAS